MIDGACEATTVVQNVSQVENVIRKRSMQLLVLTVEDKDPSRVYRSLRNCILLKINTHIR